MSKSLPAPPSVGTGAGRQVNNKNSKILEYLKRLSDVLFFLARQEEKKLMGNPTLPSIKRFFRVLKVLVDNRRRI